MQLLRAATLTVNDVEATATRYARWFGYHEIERGEVDANLATSWGAPASAGRSFCVMQPASEADVFIRLVAEDPEPAYRPLRTFGWAAIELCVQDTLTTNDRMVESPFAIIGPPRELDSMSMIFPMQVEGPDQEIIYLTEIRADPPGYILPRAVVPVDRLFILVLACADLDATKDWFERTLGIATGIDVEIVYTMLARSFDLPPTQKHRIATGIHERHSFLEFDQYPPATTLRPGRPDALKPGIALATLTHPDFAGIEGDWIAPPVRRDGTIYQGAMVGTLRAPDNTLVEIMELR